MTREHTEQAYGEATGKFVSIFQEERRLEVSGAADEPTASALNPLLDELRGPGREQPAYVLKGRFFDGFPSVGVMVSAFDRDLCSGQTLG